MILLLSFINNTHELVGFHFLKVPADARTCALAGIVWPSEGYGIFSNPVMLQGEGREVFFSGRYHLAGSIEEIGWKGGFGRFSLGAGLRVFYVPGIELRGDIPGELYGTYPSLEGDMVFSVAGRLTKDLLGGVSIHRLFQQIFDKTEGLWAWGLSLMHYPAKWMWVYLGADYISSSYGDGYHLPTTVKLGAGVRVGNLLFGIEGVKPYDTKYTINAGVEIGYEMLRVRGGLRAGHDTELGSLGIGVEWKRFSIDYAGVVYRYLGVNHTGSVKVRL